MDGGSDLGGRQRNRSGMLGGGSVQICYGGVQCNSDDVQRIGLRAFGEYGGELIVCPEEAADQCWQ